MLTRQVSLLAFVAATLLPCAVHANEKPKPPNVIIMLFDDMGFSDLGAYGGEIDTPNLDELAEHGLRFRQAYNSARCCPTRASLLTGLHPHQAGVGHMTQDRGVPGYRGALTEEAVTIPEVLRQANYQTWMVGKWHLSPDYDKADSPSASWPIQRGFDRFYGTLPGAVSYWDPLLLMRDNEFIEPDDGDYYYTEAVTDNAIRFIREADDRPFFLYFAHLAPHWPLHAREEVIAKYHGRYAAGWDAMRQERYARMIELGVIDPQHRLSPRDEQSVPWENAPHKLWEQRRMEVHAAMIEHADRELGRMIAALKAADRWENTLFVALSDNGASPEGHRDGMVPRLNLRWQGPFIPTETRNGRPIIVGDFPEVMPGSPTTFSSYDIKWSNLSNSPFRLHKSWLHEGGIATPMIVHWPAGISAQNEWCDQPVHVIDLMATCVDVAGAIYPKQRQGRSVTPMEGVSIAPLFHGRSLKRHTLYWEHEGNRAVRRGDWKLVSEYPGDWNRASATGEWELYNLAEDRTELNDLAHEKPELVQELSALYDAWAERVGVIPWKTLVREHPVEALQK